MNIFLYLWVMGLMSLAALWQWGSTDRSRNAIILSIKLIPLSFVMVLLSCVWTPLSVVSSVAGFRIDALAVMTVLLILCISSIVHLFSWRYMQGDRCLNKYFLNLMCLTVSLLGLALSDHVILFAFFWTLNQLLLSRLMIHKSEWDAAKQGGLLFLKWGLTSAISLMIGLTILAFGTGSFSIKNILTHIHGNSDPYQLLSIGFIVFAALVQSGLWPSHRWLMSSLNAPTPVSAFMHGGIVNGGGLLLARFAPLVLTDPIVLQLLFGIGVISVLVGTLWKLMQSNVKKLLACSTMAQMGFMVLQCGLGLFPAAIAHVCWHGLFKGFLFLNSGSALESKILSKTHVSRSSALYCAAVALAAALVFSWAAELSLNSFDTQMVLIFFTGLGAFHISLTVLRCLDRWAYGWALLISLVLAALYGMSLHAIESVFQPMGLWQPQPLGTFYITGVLLIGGSGLIMNYLSNKFKSTLFWKKFYVSMLNASQSDHKTVTAIRNHYQF